MKPSRVVVGLVVLASCSTAGHKASPSASPTREKVVDRRCPGATVDYPAKVRESTKRAVEALVENEFENLGARQHDVFVDLEPGREALAAKLYDRFGDRLFITMGTTEYCGHPGRSKNCPDLPAADPTPDGLRFVLHLDRTEIRRTDGLQGMLTVTTSGPDFRMDTGDPLTASIVEPGTRHVVATVAGQGGIAGVGRDLTPANHIGVLVGTARCDGGIGSALPPGSYGVVVRITAEGSGDKRAFLSEEAPLTVRP